MYDEHVHDKRVWIQTSRDIWQIELIHDNEFRQRCTKIVINLKTNSVLLNFDFNCNFVLSMKYKMVVGSKNEQHLIPLL